jgi:hypothetical protein
VEAAIGEQGEAGDRVVVWCLVIHGWNAEGRG